MSYENEVDAQQHIYDPNTTQTTVSSVSSEVDADDMEDLETKMVVSNKQSEDLKALYTANSLAAAQMLQLMSSNGNAGTVGQHQPQDGITISSAVVDHEKENIPICKYCNKIFANFSNLNHHISAIHLNQSKWICSQCGKVCSSKSNLKVHLRVHLRVKPYHCRWCSYSCMHHSSIRDHLAKVHPEKTHTPLQPGYIFNSQAVPEPDVFNSKGFNVSTFVNDSKMKRTNEKQQNDRTPEKIKKCRLNPANESTSKANMQAPHSMQYQAINTNVQISPPQNAQSSPNMSNIYNAYQMARMLPFMYPMQLQYAAAAAAANQQQAAFHLYNPANFQAYQQQQRLYSNTNISTNSFEDQTTSSYSSNSHSSRSSSLSPSDKQQQQQNEIVNLVSKQIKSMATTIDDYNTTRSIIKIQPESPKPQESIETQTHDADDEHEDSTTEAPIVPAMASSPKHNTTLTVDQILSNKSNKSTQTDSSCLKCPYCSNKAL